tara:strand:- start:788 stop:1642 length:855 start_codon:yes stop_codon:yes gene_type:complete
MSYNKNYTKTSSYPNNPPSGAGAQLKMPGTIGYPTNYFQNLNATISSSTTPWVPSIDNIKSYEVYELREDLLALSVTWNRLGSTCGASGVTDEILFKLVSDEDRTTANIIREYYSKKIMLWNLKGRSLTRFRTDLNTFIHNTTKIYTASVFGLAYWLPKFYKYDTELDTIRFGLPQVEYFEKSVTMEPIIGVKSLRPLKKLYKETKHLKRAEYWFVEESTNVLSVISIESNNPLMHIWECMFNTMPKIDIYGTYICREKDELSFYGILKWKLDSLNCHSFHITT